MENDFVELERRLVIGLNEQLSLGSRKDLILKGINLSEISKEIPNFRMYSRETRDILHWLSCGRKNSIIWYGDSDFPKFAPLKSRLPYFLLCQGQKPNIRNEYVGIVGTRHATYQGLQQAYRLGLESSENGISIISGFAEGIDQAGMRGCLDGYSPCIGVLACGHNIEYPSLTSNLRERIIDQGGTILSRFAPYQEAYKSNFIARNMIIAAYSNFIVAVQAPRNSGTLNTCEYANQLGKNVFVANEGIGDRYAQFGTSQLFREGAKVIFSMTECYDLALSKCVGEVSVPIGTSGYKRFGDRMYMVRDAQN